MAISKKDLIKAIAADTNVTMIVAEDMLAALGKIASAQLRQADEFNLPGIGCLHLQRRPERPGRNPATNERVTLAPSNAVKFKVSATLKAAVN